MGRYATGERKQMALACLAFAMGASACSPANTNAGEKAKAPVSLTGDAQSVVQPTEGSSADGDSVQRVGDQAPSQDGGGAPAISARRSLDQVHVPSDGEIAQLVATDHDKVGKDGGGGVIYVDIHRLATHQVGTTDLEVYRYGIAKALNSVSLNATIVKLVPLDQAETLFRVKLADYTLEKAWQFIAKEKHASANVTSVGGATVVQGDWLVFAISRPEIYDRIMNIPLAVPVFESQLKPDYSKAVYVNVTDSSVTFFGRVLQRIPFEAGGKPGGYYWRSYDVAGKNEQAAAFANPKALRYATVPTLVAGEYFFSLPNGMQGYYVSGFAMQTRLDAQLFVATDFRRPQDGLTTCVGNHVKSCGFVLNGESCMTCHENGINAPKTIAGTSGAASAKDITAFFAADQKRFQDALAEMGYDINMGEPINATLTAFRQRTSNKDRRVQGGELEGVTPAGSLLKR